MKKVLAFVISLGLMFNFLPAKAAAPAIGSCQIFPSDNAWNQDISNLPVDSRSAAYINSIGGGGHLHADFGGNGEYGIPYIVVSGSQAKVPINFTAYGDESDPGPYPIPANAPVEGASSDPDGDRHVLVVDQGNCKLYELYRAFYKGPGWDADSGAVFDLKSNALRPDGWTSTDAAGLPVFAGLARYDEVAAGAINHALRFTVSRTQKKYIYPARHFASSNTDPSLPPMGLRLRLKNDFDVSKFTGQAKIILTALKKYGMIVADNGSNWYITGDGNKGWNDDDLNQLKTVPGSAFEAVDTSSVVPGSVPINPTPTPQPTPTPNPMPTPKPAPVAIQKVPAPAVKITKSTDPKIGIAVRINLTKALKNVQRVDFMLGKTRLGYVKKSPYAFTWKKVKKGTYKFYLQVKFWDGKIVKSQTTKIIVK